MELERIKYFDYPVNDINFVRGVGLMGLEHLFHNKLISYDDYRKVYRNIALLVFSQDPEMSEESANDGE